jgi:hypothetical protein
MCSGSMQAHFRTAAVRRLAECFWQNTSAARIDLQPKRPAPQHSSPMLSALIRIPSSETLRSQRLPICQVNSPFRSAPAIYAARSAPVASAFLNANFIISWYEFESSASRIERASSCSCERDFTVCISLFFCWTPRGHCLCGRCHFPDHFSTRGKF